MTINNMQNALLSQLQYKWWKYLFDIGAAI